MATITIAEVEGMRVAGTCSTCNMRVVLRRISAGQYQIPQHASDIRARFPSGEDSAVWCPESLCSIFTGVAAGPVSGEVYDIALRPPEDTGIETRRGTGVVGETVSVAPPGPRELLEIVLLARLQWEKQKQRVEEADAEADRLAGELAKAENALLDTLKIKRS